MRLFPLLPLLALVACNTGGEGVEAANGSGAGAAAPVRNAAGKPFAIQQLGDFDEPWAMAFLPNGDALITERKGKLLVWSRKAGAAAVTEVSGVPEVDYGGQGGLGDVAVNPRNGMIYLSWVEAGPNDTRGAVVGRAHLLAGSAAVPGAKAGYKLDGLEVIWRQTPKVEGRGHFSHRIVFAPDGKMFLTSGERQKFDPAQDMSMNLGKVLRLNDDGTVPRDNPFASRGGVTAQIWSLGHRNLLGLAFAPDGRLWENEMGPKGGDEFNRIERGSNYGYPIVSNGDHYDGKDIPDHNTRPEFNAPEVSWTPVISPSSLMFYTGKLFPQWRGSAFIGGLSSKALVRVTISGDTAREAERWDMGERIREVEQGPDGAIWVLEDGGKSAGRLLRLAPAGR
ncbi:MAG TPA: PQQ-dependent sugar dehydrogenase [Allosphingosinicella sp.]